MPTASAKPTADAANGFKSGSAEQLANYVLESQWLGKGFPVDPAWIASSLGIKVVEMSLPPNVSGALIKKEGSDPAIILERSDSKNRKRFSCAHELGHYVRRLGTDSHSYKYIDLRGDLARAGTDPEEIFANNFAACLLMPEDEVRGKLRESNSRLELAQYFGVSDEALSIRLNKLKLQNSWPK